MTCSAPETPTQPNPRSASSTTALGGQFLIECLADLRKNLMNRGLNLMIQHGKPEEIIPSLAESFIAHTVE
ncbi:hypothetical protein Ddye_016945 [Dipteronia dyeriana]|uniref:Photolyase/cryptochrome alpha/beta domain-containing protein n=1 Tax=Dipteronia dyeriana TaxID=168575 RepID=A0AAD9X020_9ROSI|nr:hypothetical protein Ddye_016945 [Dipteronia dyeriana]